MNPLTHTDEQKNSDSLFAGVFEVTSHLYSQTHISTFNWLWWCMHLLSWRCSFISFRFVNSPLLRPKTLRRSPAAPQWQPFGFWSCIHWGFFFFHTIQGQKQITTEIRRSPSLCNPPPPCFFHPKNSHLHLTYMLTHNAFVTQNTYKESWFEIWILSKM